MRPVPNAVAARTPRADAARSDRRERRVLGALLALAGIGNALGYLYFFDVVWSYDKFMHVYTSFAVALTIAALLRAALFARLRARPALVVLTLVAYGLALGVIWEWIEWVVDIRGYPSVIMGKSDTMIDLIADAVGAALAGAWIARRLAH
ncbi:MAG: hypothetical protein ACLGHO_11430 [Gammaproteobacteria bacterium]